MLHNYCGRPEPAAKSGERNKQSDDETDEILHNIRSIPMRRSHCGGAA